MTSIEKSIIINKPVAEVFSYASNWKKWHNWFEGVSAFKPVTQTSRGNGTRYAYKVKMMGFSLAVETEIHDFEPNKGWNSISTNGTPHKTHWKFEPAGHETKFTYGLEFKLPVPILGPVIDKMILKPQWERIISNSLQNLKQVLTDH